MNERFLLEEIDEGCAVLRRDDGARLRLLADWLPADARPGAALDVAVSPGPDESGLVVRVVEGLDEPDRESVGG